MSKLFVVQHRDVQIVAEDDVANYGIENQPFYVGPYPRTVEHVRQAFADRDAAEAFRDGLESAARASLNLRPLFGHYPGGLESLERLTEFDPPVLLDWLTDHDIPHPPPDRGHWGQACPWEGWLLALTRQQITDLFRGLHLLEFYEMFEIDLVAGAYEPEQWEPWERDLPPLPAPQPRVPAPPAPRRDLPPLPYSEDDIPF